MPDCQHRGGEVERSAAGDDQEGGREEFRQGQGGDAQVLPARRPRRRQSGEYKRGFIFYIRTTSF